MVLDLHLHDPQFGVGSGRGSGETTAELGDDMTVETESGGRSRMRALVALLVLVGIAYGVRRMRRSGTGRGG